MATRRGRQGQIVWEDLTVYPRPGVITVLWRWRTELALIAAALLAWRLVASLAGPIVTIVLGVIVAGLLAGIPATRNAIKTHGRATLTRHQLYAAFREIRATTRAGRLPLVVWIRPTPAGERAVIWCRAGVCAEDLHSQVDRIRTACWAKDVRVTASVRSPQLVRLEFLRREPPPAVIIRPALPAPRREVLAEAPSHIDETVAPIAG